MMQQLRFQSGGKHIDSPVRSGNSGISSVPPGAELTEQATGISYGESRKSLQQETGYRCESAGISGKRHGKFGVTEAENVKTVIFENLEKRANRSPWKFPTESTENCRKAIAQA